MQDERSTIEGFLTTVHPYDSLPRDELARVAGSFSRRHLAAGVEIYGFGDPLAGIFLIENVRQIRSPTEIYSRTRSSPSRRVSRCSSKCSSQAIAYLRLVCSRSRTCAAVIRFWSARKSKMRVRYRS